MCGIAGIFHLNKRGEDHISQIQTMVQLMHHRGPDYSSYVEINPALVLGHARLSIIDTTSGSNQPFRYNNDVLVFNGEIYNFKALGAKLQFYEHFEVNSDTEVLARGLFHYGIDFVNELNGMFAFAYWQSATQTLWLVRDRMGIKPLYWYVDSEKILFSSEIRPIAKIIRPEIERNHLAEFLTFQTSLSSNTLLKGVSMVAPGAKISIKRKRSPITHSYYRWQSAYHQPSQPITIEALRTKVIESVKERLIADVPLGAFLSGGVDSSVVIAAMRASTSQTIKTFTVGFHSEKHDERSFAHTVARHFETDHSEIVLSNEEILQSIQESIRTLDFPTGDGINSYIVSKAVKQAGITVALSGIGGDELFAGYPSFYRLNQYPFFRGLMKLVPGSIVHRIPSRILYKKSMLLKENNSARDMVKYSRMVCTPAQLSLLGLSVERSERIMEETDEEIRMVGLHELSFYTLPLLLRDTDQMSMQHSLEVRVPLLDAELVQLMAKVNNQQLQLHTSPYPKSFLIEAFKAELPESVYKRKKQGFAIPMDDWIAGPLKELTLNGLFETPLTDFVEKKGIDSLWNEYKEGKIPWSVPWTLSVLGHWLENMKQL